MTLVLSKLDQRMLRWVGRFIVTLMVRHLGMARVRRVPLRHRPSDEMSYPAEH